ncbi:phosphatase PAP2 family protein [Novosphingobium malaysiense]|uniref:phosphatase PAP2 family protein n=1 Tax=Novosphingobium malaysiense TaxID=1348853 RepID=UPI0018CFA2A2|nr:phosphatase PAP2 family protein [Novosphingobium malaysiense]
MLQAINGLAGHSRLFDLAVDTILGIEAIRTLPLVLCIIWLWFDRDTREDRRQRLAQMMFGTFLALAVARVTQNLMPFHPRPFVTPGLDLVTPYGFSEKRLHEWSSFPSDNAALAFAMTVGLWRASRPVGWFALLWTLGAFCFPKVFAGMHYPSDIIAGAVIGWASVLLVAWVLPPLASRPLVSAAMTGLRSRRWSRPAFYCAMFVVLFGIVTLFEDARHIARGAYEHLIGGEDCVVEVRPVSADSPDCQ